jgi:hypothetical protein
MSSSRISLMVLGKCFACALTGGGQRLSHGLAENTPGRNPRLLIGLAPGGIAQQPLIGTVFNQTLKSGL